MDYVKEKKDSIKEKYVDWLDEAKGGIFRRSAREKMIGVKRLPAQGQPLNDFWYTHRLNISSALIDLAIFLQTAGPNNVRQVITLQSIKPVIDSIFMTDIEGPNSDIVDPEKAKLAHYMIDIGFWYLERINPHYITRLSSRVIYEAREISQYLTAIALPDDQRKYLGTSLENSKHNEPESEESE